MTKERWKQLNPKEQWDIDVALRGPDCHNSEGIKWYTTAVIRGQMEPVRRVGGTINKDLRMVIVPLGLAGPSIPTEAQTIPHLFIANFSHFMQHVSEAGANVGVPVVSVPRKEYWDVMASSRHFVEIGDRILEVMKTYGVESSKFYGMDYSPYITELTRHLENIHKGVY